MYSGVSAVNCVYFCVREKVGLLHAGLRIRVRLWLRSAATVSGVRQSPVTAPKLNLPRPLVITMSNDTDRQRLGSMSPARAFAIINSPDSGVWSLHLACIDMADAENMHLFGLGFDTFHARALASIDDNVPFGVRDQFHSLSFFTLVIAIKHRSADMWNAVMDTGYEFRDGERIQITAYADRAGAVDWLRENTQIFDSVDASAQ